MSIGDNGNWYVNDEDTGYKAYTSTGNINIQNYYYYIGNTKAMYMAKEYYLLQVQMLIIKFPQTVHGKLWTKTEIGRILTLKLIRKEK